MKRSPRLLTVPVLVVVLFAVILGFATPAGAWEENSVPDRNGWGTHDWILKAASDLAGGWVNMAIAQPASDDPDNIYFDWLNHSYDVWGTVKKGTAPTVVRNHYNLAVGYLHAGNVAAASKEVGLMGHYYADMWQPLHTEWDDAAAQNLYHRRYELDVMGHEPSSAPTYSPVRVSDPYAATVTAATTSHGYYSIIMNAYKSSQGYAGAGVDSTTKDLLNRAAEGLADLIYSIKLDAQIFQQNDANLGYIGTWTTNSATAASRGSFLSTNATGSCTVSFNGTYLAWLAKKSPAYGKAKLTLDGVAQGTVDLYNATAFYGKVWETTTLSSGTHTLKIEWTGTKNASATDYNISVDAFDIAGTIAPAPKLTRYQQTESRLAFAGAWTTGSSSSYSGSSAKYANASGASVTVTFTGTYLAWIAKKSPVYGKATVTLDGTTTFTVDLYSASTRYQQKAWDTGPLDSGTHTLRIAWTGTKNSSATATNIGVDAFDLLGSLVAAAPPGPVATRYDQNAGGLAYTGTWETFATTKASGGSYLRARTSDASVTITFDGTYLAWIATAGTTLSKAYVSLDGKPEERVDLARSVVGYQQNVWRTGTLTPGVHTVTIRRDPTNAATKYISLDAVEIVGTLK